MEEKNYFMEQELEREAWKELSKDWTWTEEWLTKYQDRIDWNEISGNKQIFWTASMLDKFKQEINWEQLSIEASERILTIENLERFKNFWDWKNLSRNDNFNLSYELIDRFIDCWDWNILIDRWLADEPIYGHAFFEKYQDYIPASKL